MERSVEKLMRSSHQFLRFTRAKPHPYLLMQPQTVQLYKQKENRKQNGQPLKKMIIMLASQHENNKQSVQPLKKTITILASQLKTLSKLASRIAVTTMLEIQRKCGPRTNT